MSLLQRVCQLIEQHGGLRPAARVIGIDAGYLHRLATGEKCKPSKKILARMGLREVISYERIGK